MVTGIEQHLDPLDYAHTQMMIAVMADVEVLRHLIMMQHRLATGALLPQIVWKILLGHQRLDFRAHEVRNPAHVMATDVVVPKPDSVSETDAGVIGF